MKFETQLALLDRAYEALAQGERDTAKQISLPVVGEMNRELFAATRRTHLPGLGYKRHYLNINDYLTVLRAQGFAATSLDSVTAISWNKHFNDDDSYTLVGSLVRHSKRYGIYDHRADPRAVRALAFLSAFIANKMCRPREDRLVMCAPSSLKSMNTLPKQLSELVAYTSRRYDLPHPKALERCRDIGQMKNIVDVNEKLRMIKDSMISDRELVRGRQVLLVDDLLGSGATLRESARALKVAGASEVHALVMVKTRKFAREVMCNQ